MLKRVILILIFCVVQQSFAQHCSEESTEQNDANSISQITKCKVEKSETTDKNSSKDLSLSKRFLKRRNNKDNSIILLTQLESENKEERSVESIDLENIKKNINSLADAIKKTSKKNIVSFSDVDRVPFFPQCEKDTHDQYNCFNVKMQDHINDNFIYPEEALNNKMEGIVLVSFVIDITGNVCDIKTISSKKMELLKEEAIRIISLLPKFIPGENNDQKVNVSYSFPMEFKINSSN